MQMKTSKHFSLIIVGLLLVIAVSPILSAHADEPTPTPQQDFKAQVYLPLTVDAGDVALQNKILQIAAEKSGIPAEKLEIAAIGKGEYPLQKLTTTAVKVYAPETGESFRVTLDAQNHPDDPVVLEAQENTLRLNLYGKLEPELAEALAAGTLNEAVPVMIWLKEAPSEGLPRPDPVTGDENMPAPEMDAAQLQAQSLEQDAFDAQVQSLRAAAVKQITAPVVQRFGDLGYQVAADEAAPVIFTRLPSATLETVRNWEEVDQIYLNRNYKDTLDVARSAILAATVNNRTVDGYNITGRGVRVGVIEVNGRIATNNPYLSGVANSTTNTCSYASEHATAVTGMIRSTHFSRRGIAKDAIVWVGGSCNGEGDLLLNASTRASNWGAKIFNLSFGANNTGYLTGLDRYYDSLVINSNRTVVVAAGNEGGAYGNGYVMTPGTAYNTITVGNFDDHDTASWTDDTMHSSSSYIDPRSTHGDREKPEVSAPGSYINSTLPYSPWIGATGSGTSYATPMVVGTAALLMQRNRSLTFWPEAIKAILMTTAVNNIEGSSKISDKDGAGGIAANRADDIAHNVTGSWGAREYTCSTGSPLILPGSVYLQAGVRTRAVIAWDNDPNYSGYANQPGADLDLRIINASGATVASSLSYDNNYELIDFIPTTTGFYRLRVTRDRCSYSPHYLGWAWRRGS